MQTQLTLNLGIDEKVDVRSLIVPSIRRAARSPPACRPRRPGTWVGAGAICGVSGVSGRPCNVVVAPSSNPICRYLRF